jgi:hypothetical protein
VPKAHSPTYAVAGGFDVDTARRGRSHRSNFGKPLDCVFVLPAYSCFPCGRRLRGDVMRTIVEIGSAVFLDDASEFHGHHR